MCHSKAIFSIIQHFLEIRNSGFGDGSKDFERSDSGEPISGGIVVESNGDDTLFASQFLNFRFYARIFCPKPLEQERQRICSHLTDGNFHFR